MIFCFIFSFLNKKEKIELLFLVYSNGPIISNPKWAKGPSTLDEVFLVGLVNGYSLFN